MVVDDDLNKEAIVLWLNFLDFKWSDFFSTGGIIAVSQYIFKNKTLFLPRNGRQTNGYV